MNIRKLTTNALLLAVGAVLHQISPPLFFGVKPDFSLAMLFIIMIMNEDYQTTLICGIIAGVFAALTTALPGGQPANIIDKIITSHIIFFLLKPIRNKLNNQIKIIAATAIGTIISGSIFLTVVIEFFGFKQPFYGLFVGLVLPTALINTVVGFILYNALNLALKRSKFAR
ncbi:MAG: tryptophan transporter [Bacillota bacterium]|nr:tryptophan transporter [Bacillota bacterium]